MATRNRRSTRRPRQPQKPLLPLEHDRLVEKLGRLLDDIERDLYHVEPGSRGADRLQRQRLCILRQLADAEAEHVDACEPIAYRVPASGLGVIVTCRGGWETYLPDHTILDMEIVGIEPIAF
jgi:hypothetical protein